MLGRFKTKRYRFKAGLLALRGSSQFGFVIEQD
jgi:hypothetical protein